MLNQSAAKKFCRSRTAHVFFFCSFNLKAKPCNKSFIDQACSVTMADMILASLFFYDFVDLVFVSIHKNGKMNFVNKAYFSPGR